MKIENPDQIPTNLLAENKARSQPMPERKFGDILKETVENRKPEAAGLRQTKTISPLPAIQPAVFFGMQRPQVADRVENLIDLLDRYRQQLSDSSLALKKIDPIVKEINQALESLTPVLDSLPEDEELKDIMNQTLVTASLEVAKFYRGDYITA